MSDSEDGWLGTDPLPDDPWPILAIWLDEALARGEQPNPHAVALATVDERGDPSVRFVLCKAIELDPAAIVFYTHSTSRKGRDLARKPRASVAFYFVPEGRQARVSGSVREATDAESDAYFRTRPLDAQLGAWASEQSAPLASRADLLAEMDRLAEDYGVALDADRGAAESSDRVPRPDSFRGYRILPTRVELWHSRPGRIHDRAEWSRAGDTEPWSVQRLQP